jgi:hypothetical protein
VESGLLFLMAQFIFVVLFAIGHPAQAILEPVATQIYVCDSNHTLPIGLLTRPFLFNVQGISPTLIIVRVGMGSSYEQTTAPNSSLRFHNTKQ